MVIIQNIKEELSSNLQSFHDLKNNVKNFNYADGSKLWFKNDRFHRDVDLPAAIDSYGSKDWYKNGKRHRENDLPALIHSGGGKYWYKNDRLIKRS